MTSCSRQALQGLRPGLICENKKMATLASLPKGNLDKMTFLTFVWCSCNAILVKFLSNKCLEILGAAGASSHIFLRRTFVHVDFSSLNMI